MRGWLILAALLVAGPAQAQILPMPDSDNMRVHSVVWSPDQEVLLTLLPGASLTVLLADGDVVQRVTLGDAAPLDVRVPDEGTSFIVIPRQDITRTTLEVLTTQRQYRFILRTQDSALAALVVRFDEAERSGFADADTSQPAGGELWSYRFRGDREVRPQAIRDDARRTFIEYAPGQALPAVFAVGPTGDEEVVNGYMRNGVYVIDRVYSELVFRIDDARARAQRNTTPDASG